jgi:hypothetical protein
MAYGRRIKFWSSSAGRCPRSLSCILGRGRIGDSSPKYGDSSPKYGDSSPKSDNLKIEELSPF